MKPADPQFVKFFIGALFSDIDLLKKALELCQVKIGDVDLRSENFPFDLTTYYNEEMGQPIFRTFYSFETLRNPGDLSKLKVLCNDIEAKLAVEGKRKVNLDMGYLDFHKVVLASAKYNGQKIYLDQGIYADPTLFFEEGQFHAFEHTFPDFKLDTYNEVLLKIRNKYKDQIKS